MCDRRQGMMSNKAWQRHGCYRLGSEQYFNFPVQNALIGCHDDWNSLDHFDPTTDSRRIMKHMFDLRLRYKKLVDGFGLVKAGNWTYQIERPGSNGSITEMGLWASSRTGILGQPFTKQDPDILLLYANDNKTTEYKINCKSKDYLKTPFEAGTQLKNLFYPYDTPILVDGNEAYNNDGKAPSRGCLASVTMEPFGFKAYIPLANYIEPTPAITRFVPGHDARLVAEVGDVNATTADIAFEFNTEMNCDSVTKSITFKMSSSGHGGNPTITGAKCGPVKPDPKQSRITGVSPSAFKWEATLTNLPDGILTITVSKPNAAGTTGASTGVGCSALKEYDWDADVLVCV
jgi:alpha-1,3-glucan synthase